MTIIKNGTETLGNFLHNYVLEIPIFQRSYAWQPSLELCDYWEDIMDIVDGNNNELFIGQFVLTKDEDEDYYYIVDGQQRITSTIIFLSAS